MSSSGNSIAIGSQSYEEGIDYLIWPYGDSVQKKELEKLKLLPNLRGASFSGSNLNDEGMAVLCELSSLENLDLQGTEITNDGLCGLKQLTQLKYLRLKENWQLTNSCILHLKQIHSLCDLQIQETGISQDGLDRLSGMTSLQWIVLSVDDGNFTYERLLELSKKLPACAILAKGHGEFLNGKFKGDWRN
jgi:Leucine-rich repeat (LRR) protein